MRSIRVRFTIRRIMVVVAIAALALGGESARRRWSANPPYLHSRSALLAMALASKHFGPKHWAASSALKICMTDASRGYSVYGQDYQLVNGGSRLVLSGFAIIWQAPGGRLTRTVSGDLLDLDLKVPMGQGRGGLQLRHAWMSGNVVFGDDNATATPTDDRVGRPLPEVDFGESTLMGVGALAEPPQ